MIPDDVPRTKPCPCGRGYAEIVSEPTVEPNPKRSAETLRTFHFKHEGCPVGGSVVLAGGVREDDESEVRRMVGPLFNPRRFRSLIETLERSSAGSSTAVADGGSTAGVDFLEAVGEGSR